MNRVEKQEVVAALNHYFVNASTVVVAHNNGLSVQDMTALRKEVRNVDASFKVVKNSLAKIAVKGTAYEELAPMFTGPTAIAFSSDPVAAAKAVVNFAKENDKLAVIGGAISDEILNVKKINELAKLPSLDELRAKLVGMINTPATRIAGVVQAPAGQLARVVNAYSQQG